MDRELQNMHKKALKLVQEQLKKHSFGKLVFLSFVGTRPWGFSREKVDYDYRGIYASREENTYQAFISQVYINNYVKDITLVSLERFIRDILNSNIHSLICLNSPIVYATKDFLNFKKWANSHYCKEVFRASQFKRIPQERKDYLYDFFFIGTAISVLEYKKVISNLVLLNKHYLKIPTINKIIEEEKVELPFTQKSERVCKKILLKLKKRLERAAKKSHLPEKIETEKLFKLKIIKQINPKFWLKERYRK